MISSIIQSVSTLLYTNPLRSRICETWSFSAGDPHIFFFPPSQAVSFFKIFFTDIGVKLLDIPFSIMNRDIFVTSELVDSITMNLGKGDSVSLSEEESNSDWFCLIFFRKPYVFVFRWSNAPLPTTDTNLCWECTKGETHLHWLRRGYIVETYNCLVDMLLSNLLWVSSRPYFTGITFTFSSTTNTTQILQARKQVEYDNNEY